MANAEDSNKGGDLIWGGESIALEIGKPVGKTYYLLERKYLPAKKIGAHWVMSRKAWRKHLGIPEEAA